MESLAAEVSLHCIICFEEFDVRDRPPVVLPCGHTYVCLVCAKRLRRCMECREPLYWIPPAAQQKPPVLGNPGLNTRSSAPPTRYGVPRGRYAAGSPGLATPPAKEEPVPLPLPKNTVLMGMIEAADRQARILDEARAKKERERLHAEAVENGFDEEDTENDVGINENLDGIVSNLDPILAGMTALVGTCGTYAVREPLGLAVLPFDPNKGHCLEMEEDEAEHEHVGVTDEEKKTDERREPFTIEVGQIVQVVGVDEGVYQLARGAGYIVASVNQLVKVGGPLEKSCQYEGMLRSVLRKQDELQRDLEEINSLVDGLREKIRIEQENHPQHPVITPPKELEEELFVNDENDLTTRLSTSPATPPGASHRTDPSSPGRIIQSESGSSTEVNLGTNPRTPGQHVSEHHGYIDSPAKSCPIPGRLQHELTQPYIDGESTGLPQYRINSDDEVHGLPWTFGCGSTLFGERLLERDCDPAHGLAALSFDDTFVEGSMRSQVVPGQSFAARAIAANSSLTQHHSDLRSGSFDGPINFRTGMSGHTGLNSSRKKNSPLSRPHIRMMSDHRGIAATARAVTLQQAARRQHQGLLEHNTIE